MKKFKYRWVILIGLLFVSMSVGCTREPLVEMPVVEEDTKEVEVDIKLELNDEELAYIEALKSNGGLKVAIREIESVYVLKSDGTISGFNYKLLMGFSEQFDVDIDLKFVGFSEYFKLDGEVPEAVKLDSDYYYTPDLFEEVDLYCDVITILPWRQKLMRFVEVLPVRQLLIHRSGEYFEDIEVMAEKKIAVKPDTSYETQLIALESEYSMTLNRISVDSTIDQVQAVVDGRADITLKDSNIAVLELRNFDNLEIGIPVSGIQMQGWAVNKDNEILQGILEKYLSYAYDTGLRNKLWQEDYNISLNEYLKLIDVEL